jgi:hypothetical protein
VPNVLPKPNSVAIKVDDALYDFLQRMPNASEFIRHAIHAYLRTACPLCHGHGVVPVVVGEHYAPILAAASAVLCRRPGCGDREDIPPAADAVAAPDRGRWRQFFHGGPFYCRRCFDALPACEECGWHLTESDLSTHGHRPEG